MMNVVNSRKSPQDSDKFIEKTNDDVNEWMDGFYVDGRSAPFNLHCLWAWQEQERRHRAIEADLLEALQGMMQVYGGVKWDTCSVEIELQEMAKAAIAKAIASNN